MWKTIVDLVIVNKTKLIIYGVAGAAILLGIRWWGNAQWAKGEKQGRETTIIFLEKVKKEEWVAKDKEYNDKLVGLKVQQDNASKLKLDAEARIKSAEKTEQISRETLSQILIQSRATQEVLSEAAKNVSVGDLPNAMRRQLARTKSASTTIDGAGK